MATDQYEYWINFRNFLLFWFGFCSFVFSVWTFIGIASYISLKVNRLIGWKSVYFFSVFGMNIVGSIIVICDEKRKIEWISSRYGNNHELEHKTYITSQRSWPLFRNLNSFTFSLSRSLSLTLTLSLSLSLALYLLPVFFVIKSGSVCYVRATCSNSRWSVRMRCFNFFFTVFLTWYI